MTRKDARELAAVAARDGGFTYDVHTGFHPEDGFAFSRSPEHEERHVRLTARVLRGYVARHAAALRVNGSHLGAWRDGGTWYLDVSTVVADEALARTLARINEQLAIYDLATRQSLTLY